MALRTASRAAASTASAVGEPSSAASSAGPQTSSFDGVEDEVVDVESFSKRYPSLSLELVEMEIAGSRGQPSQRPQKASGLRMRDV